MPDLTRCANCGKRITEKVDMLLGRSRREGSGHLICESCGEDVGFCGHEQSWQSGGAS